MDESTTAKRLRALSMMLSGSFPQKDASYGGAGNARCISRTE